MFSSWAVSFCSHTSIVEDSGCSAFLVIFCIALSFFSSNISLSKRCILLSYYFLICDFLMANDVEYLFICLFIISSISSFVMCMFKYVALLFTDICLLSWVLGILYIWWIHVLCQRCDLRIFSKSLRLVFHSLNRIFQRTDVFNFDEVHRIERADWE